MKPRDPKVDGVSRSEAKRLVNTARAVAAQVGGMASRKVENLEESNASLREEVLRLRRDKANALALVEAFVHRHGATVFDREQLETSCARGQVAYDVIDGRITVRLKLQAVPEADTKVK